MALKSLEAWDFCCFEHLAIKLRKRGLVWIGGDNRDTSAADSNGSGKSTIFKAIGWAGYGQSTDEADGDQVIRSGAKVAKTKLTFDNGWVALRDRRRAQPKLQLIDPSGEPFPGSKEELQLKLDELMGADWAAFHRSVMYGQRDNKRFIDPKTPDKERKDVLQRIVRTALWSLAHDWIKAELSKVRKEVVSAETARDQNKARLEEYDVEALTEEEHDWDTERAERLKKVSAGAKAQIKLAKDLRKSTPDTAGLEARLAKLKKAQTDAAAMDDTIEELATAERTAGDAANAADSSADGADRAVERAQDALGELDGDECPLCHGSLASGAAAEHRGHLAQALEDAKAAAKKAAAKKVKADKAWEEARKQLKAAKERRSKLRLEAEGIDELRDELAEARGAKDRAKVAYDAGTAALGRFKEIKAEVNPFHAQIEKAKARIAECQAIVDESEAKLGKLRTDMAHLEFWNKGFSPSGLPSFALDALMPFLTERANHYLDVLADGDITVNFSTLKELKSAKGEFRDEISLTWEVEGQTGYPPSGGQWKKMEIATNFALMDLVATREGAANDLLLLDEVFDGLDAEGIDRVGHLLQKLRAERGTIMVISHSASMQEWFERAIIVRKSDGISTLEAA
jgi:DNA repair exonuclease SbcCD ATPase subunit